jgi:uncharacterized membrane protein YdjX (TVP38/TMEM64 family)
MQTMEVQPAGVRTDQHQPSPPATATRWPRWGLAALLVLAVVGFYALGLHRYFSWDFIRINLDTWQAEVRDNLLLAVAVFFVVYVAVTGLSLPAAAILTMVAGTLFGRWLGTGVVSIASTLGATLAFLSSRYVLRDWVQWRFGGRLGPVNQGVDKDGAYYLFTLRLVPPVPFFLINLGMGLTPMRVITFAAVSWLGMLLGTFLYVNAGTELATLDSPADLLSWKVLGSLALLGVVPLVIRKFIQWKVRWRAVGLVGVGVLLVASAGLGLRTYFRYRTADTMTVPVREYTNAEYPEDPADRSLHFGQYDGRRLTLVKKDATHFDFVFESDNPHVAKVVFRDVDVSLMTPGLPEWTKTDDGLRRIALTDRQWNRQQVRFGGPGSPHVEVSGGDGWERENLYSAELAKNCLNAGLWEVLLFTKEDGDKALYYQGWFTLPLGHYKDLFEYNTGLPYWKHWYYLEHWFDPAGTPVPMDKLREVVRKREVNATFDKSENVIATGEQARKRRTTVGENIVTWGDFYDGRKIRFASFIPPGRYSLNHPWKNEYLRMDRFDKAILREIKSPATDRTLHELELVFSSTKREGTSRFIISGFDLDALPQLPAKDYPKGLYMPIGVGTPPFFQSYEELQKNPSHKSPYVSVLLDEQDLWIDHHSVAIDGPVLHRDENAPGLLHIYLLSYERHSLIAHFVISTGE